MSLRRSSEDPRGGDDRRSARARGALTETDLYDDVNVIQLYGAEHPDVLGSVWFEGTSLHVGVTALVPHAAELRALLPHPEAVHVHKVPRSAQDLEAVADELVGLMVSGGLVRRMSTGRDRVEVHLRAGSSALAAQLRARYGDAVSVVDADEDPSPPAAAPGPTSTTQRPELQLTVLPDADVLVGGEPGHGQLRVTNRSSSVQHLETDQPLHACLIGPDGTLTGTFIGLSTGTGLTLVLQPGQSHEVPYVVGTETAGYRASTPGAHQLVVVLPLHDIAEDPEPSVQLVSPAVPVSVTAAQTSGRVDKGDSAAPG